MYGAIEFYKKAEKTKIHPILGVTLYVKHAEETQIYPIVLLAENKEGYQNPLALTS